VAKAGVPLGRTGQAQDIANAVRELRSVSQGGLIVRIPFPPADSLGLAQTRPLHAEKPAVPRGWEPQRSAETRGTGRECANRRVYLCRAMFQYRSDADVVWAAAAVPG
jgi:hypothetical protein